MTLSRGSTVPGLPVEKLTFGPGGGGGLVDGLVELGLVELGAVDLGAVDLGAVELDVLELGAAEVAVAELDGIVADDPLGVLEDEVPAGADDAGADDDELEGGSADFACWLHPATSEAQIATATSTRPRRGRPRGSAPRFRTLSPCRFVSSW